MWILWPHSRLPTPLPFHLPLSALSWSWACTPWSSFAVPPTPDADLSLSIPSHLHFTQDAHLPRPPLPLTHDLLYPKPRLYRRHRARFSISALRERERERVREDTTQLHHFHPDLLARCSLIAHRIVRLYLGAFCRSSLLTSYCTLPTVVTSPLHNRGCSPLPSSTNWSRPLP
jgi:hypothetical protein